MFNRKKEVIKRLKNTYCRLKPSAIAGVGIFAIRDIPKNVNPFKGIRTQQWYRFSISQFKKIDKEVLKMIDDFYAVEEDKTVLIPEYGLNGMNISFFLNNSRPPNKPNVKTIDGGATFVALRKIKKGEELTIAYGTYDYKYKEDKPLKKSHTRN